MGDNRPVKNNDHEEKGHVPNDSIPIRTKAPLNRPMKREPHDEKSDIIKRGTELPYWGTEKKTKKKEESSGKRKESRIKG